MKQSMFMILENEELAPDVHQLILEGDTSAIKCAGQFVEVKLDKQEYVIVRQGDILAIIED